MDFTKISNVPLLEEVPENTNAIVEVDGTFQRVPGKYLSGVTLTEFYTTTEGVPEDQFGFYVLADKTATEPITYDTFKAAYAAGIVRLYVDPKAWFNSDETPDGMTMCWDCPMVLFHDPLRAVAEVSMEIPLYFSDSDFSSATSLSETKLRWRNE